MKISSLLQLTSILVLGGIMAMTTFASTQAAPKPSDNWLLDAKDDPERFKRIQQMFGGFSGAMLVVGERYDRTYDAIADGNLALADYHWKKIKEAIELGYLRRPGREPNAVSMFLKGPWQHLADALAAKAPAKAKETFAGARAACQACHVAERAPFMNDQPRFRRTASFAAP